MIYIVDTHALIWHISGDKKLGNEAVAAIENPDNIIFISKASLWEMVIKLSLEKLELSIPFEAMEDFLKENEYSILDFGFDDLKTLYSLPFHHSDPFDRLIIAQAITNEFIVITSDKNFESYPVKILK